MVEHWWHELDHAFANAQPDEFIIMPNHIHGIIMMTEDEGGHTGPPLPRIVGWLKTMTTNEYIRNVSELGWPPFARRLWQQGYYERVVRNETELARVREYISGNPLRWDLDIENADRPAGSGVHKRPADDIELILGKPA